jgi:hypothetical protein
MKRFAPLGVAVIAALIAQCALADKSGELIDATNPKKIASVIQDLGYRAKLEVDDDGDPVIRSGAGGSNFSIQFYGCKEDSNDECDLLLFSTGYDFDEETALETINSWNEQALVGRAYLDDDGDPRFDWAVNMRDGVSRENFEDSIRRWAESLGDFEDHIDY